MRDNFKGYDEWKTRSPEDEAERQEARRRREEEAEEAADDAYDRWKDEEKGR